MTTHEVYEEQSIRMRTAKDRKVEENFPTLRDQFAIAALNGMKICKSSYFVLDMNGDPTEKLDDDYINETAMLAYKMADAMMKARREK